MVTFSIQMIDIRVIEFVDKKEKKGLLFPYGVSAFAVASTEYVTVNLAPESVWHILLIVLLRCLEIKF
jgi:hypothetical protein